MTSPTHTDLDTQRDPAELLRHQLVVRAGHGEYWTKEIREAFDAARDGGTNLAFTGANTGYWQIRYEDGLHTVVSYKSPADPALKTVLFRDLVPPRWECELLGVQHAGGFQRPRDPPYAYAVAAPADRWLAGTGLAAEGDLPDLAGGEWDGLPPAPCPAACFKPTLRVLLHGATNDGAAVRYLAPSGARVFSAGSLHFSWGLDDYGSGSGVHVAHADAGVQQLVRNALDDLTRPARPTRLFARAGGAPSSCRSMGPSGATPTWSSCATRAAGRFARTSRARPSFCRIAAGGNGCVDAGARRHRGYRYEAVERNRWATSEPAATPPVTIH